VNLVFTAAFCRAQEIDTARHPDHADNVVLDLVAVGSGTTTKSTSAVVYPDLPVESPREKPDFR
jgi:hypothetical protein